MLTRHIALLPFLFLLHPTPFPPSQSVDYSRREVECTYSAANALRQFQCTCSELGINGATLFQHHCKSQQNTTLNPYNTTLNPSRVNIQCATPSLPPFPTVFPNRFSQPFFPIVFPGVDIHSELIARCSELPCICSQAPAQPPPPPRAPHSLSPPFSYRSF